MTSLETHLPIPKSRELTLLIHPYLSLADPSRVHTVSATFSSINVARIQALHPLL